MILTMFAASLNSLIQIESSSKTHARSCMKLLNLIIRLSHGSETIWYRSITINRVALTAHDEQQHTSQPRHSSLIRLRVSTIGSAMTYRTRTFFATTFFDTTTLHIPLTTPIVFHTVFESSSPQLVLSAW